MISKTKQLEKFNELLKDKSFNQKCHLRLEHETVKYYDNRKRTKAQIAKDSMIPLSMVTLFLSVPIEIWDSIMTEEQYSNWIGRELGPSFMESQMRRIGKNSPCGTRTYKPKITESIKSY